MRTRRTTDPGDDRGGARAGRQSRWRARLTGYAIPRARILLGLKTGLAVSLAWVAAQHMPGVLDEYPYYAPLGAITAMYPTIFGSLRGGLQTLTGLALGLVLAAGVLAIGDPNLLTIGAAVSIGVLLSGMRRLGAGASYVPIAALFALIIGSDEPWAYSVSFLVQMAVGVGIGLVVNAVVIPPLDFRTACLELNQLQDAVIDYLHDLADGLEKPGTIGRWNRDRRSQDLSRLTAQVREAVEESADSARANPRVALRRGASNTDPGYRRLQELESVVFHLRDLTEVLDDIYDPRTGQWLIPKTITDQLAEILRRTAESVHIWADDQDTTEQTGAVRTALGRLYDALESLSRADQRLVITAIEDLERLVDVLDPPPSPTGSTSTPDRH